MYYKVLIYRDFDNRIIDHFITLCICVCVCSLYICMHVCTFVRIKHILTVLDLTVNHWPFSDQF